MAVAASGRKLALATPDRSADQGCHIEGSFIFLETSMNPVSAAPVIRAVRGLLASGVLAAAMVIGQAASASAQINFAGTTAFRFGTSGAFTSQLQFGGVAGQRGTFANHRRTVESPVISPPYRFL